MICLTIQQVHVWRLQLAPASDAEYEQLWTFLDAGECRRAAAMGREVGRRRFVMAHGRLRRVLSAYLGRHPGAIAFATEPGGKPCLSGSDAGRLVFNLSHSGDIALIAVAVRGALGVDVELWRHLSDVEALVRRCFARSERDNWMRLPAVRRGPAFFARWTQKEAFVKACGKGIALGLKQCIVGDGEAPVMLSVPSGCGESRIWKLFPLDLGEGMSGTVAYNNRDSRLQCFELTQDRLADVVPVTAAEVNAGDGR